MNKAQLIDTIASNAGISKKQACATIDAMTNIITEILKKGRKINVIGLGIFSVYKRPARTGRNPQTGIKIMIEEKQIVRLRMGQELAWCLNPIHSNRSTLESVNS